ncbi:MAG: hypothetical protein IPK79_05720 [Vampirovibrionales bacterium]|nr:hypothetical protein [Vampirovibrionales bacterium]
MKLPSRSFRLSKESILLMLARAVSYGINALIIAVILGLAAGGCYMLYLAITA